ncbi:MAG: ATP-binding protein [Pseudomonadota bacterium]
MAFSAPLLFAIALTYLLVLFGSAYATERGWLPESLTRHPLTRLLSLGVFAGAISFYGAIGLAAHYGSAYFLYFVGTSAAFLTAPMLLASLGRTALAHNLGSLADVFSFRYPAPWVGGVVSLLMLVSVLPLIALQIHAISITFLLLNQALSEDVLAVIFCITMSVFAILFGARHLSTRDKHEGLVVALGLESLVKLAAFVGIAVFALYGVFDGPAALSLWLEQNRDLLMANETELSHGATRSLLLMSFAAAVALPHVYHILLTENDDAELLHTSRWGFPLYMLIMAACVPLILWGAIRLGSNAPPELFAIGIGLASNNTAVTVLAFVGGLAATSGVIIVSTLAIASMTLNHVLLPFYRPVAGINFYALVINTRRLLIVAIIFLAYGVNRLLDPGQEIMSLGIVAFVAVLQFLPGLVGAFYWRRGNRAGLAAGLLAGYLVWFVALFFPLVSDLVYSTMLTASPLLYEPRLYEPAENAWHFAVTASLTVNAIAYIFFSLATRSSAEEISAANDCISDSFTRPYRGALTVQSVSEIERGVASAIGPVAAAREVGQALTDLQLDMDESRPYALQQIRNRIESSLSSLMGQTIAHRIIHRTIPYTRVGQGTENVHAIETRLEDFRFRLTGFAAELDALRRYHRQILHDLPTAVFSINREGHILTWNREMQKLTAINSDRMTGSSMRDLPAPWQEILGSFAFGDAVDQFKVAVKTDRKPLLLNLHKAAIANLPSVAEGDVVIVVEDITDEHMLEQQLMHNERLASIGQLAAGVAHEIGNPITGIACLAQNLRLEATGQEHHELADQILEQTARVSTILQSLVNFSHGGTQDVHRPSVPVNLRQCTDEAINLLSLSQSEHGISFQNSTPASLSVMGDPQRLAQVFVNVLANARDASSPGGVVRITGKQQQDRIEISIADQGHGIAEDKLNKVFEPFFTTKEPGEGTGLGLAIASSIIREHQGTIMAESAGDGLGTQVTIRLPCRQQDTSPPASTC